MKQYKLERIKYRKKIGTDAKKASIFHSSRIGEISNTVIIYIESDSLRFCLKHISCELLSKYGHLQRDLARFTVEIMGLFTSVDVTKVSYNFAE